jgi:hypothetical protein
MTSLGVSFFALLLDDPKQAKLIADLASRIGLKMWGIRAKDLPTLLKMR